MKFNFKLNENYSSDSRRLHKNLFLEDFSQADEEDLETNQSYQYIDEYESDYDEKIEKNSKYYKLNDFSMPLTG